MSPPLPNSPPAGPPENAAALLSDPVSYGEFSADERSFLLSVARDSIAAALESRTLALDPGSEHLSQPRGAFTSLYRQGNLRGCVGYVLPTVSIYRAVAETARAAAFDDDRFSPIRREELPELDIELSILSVPQPVQPDAIEVGRHGLLIIESGRRGLLLPQVAVDRGWDRVTFLEQTCLKAGLPPDAWRKGASIAAFSAEVFATKVFATKV